MKNDIKQKINNSEITVIIPAYNEKDSIEDTIKSLKMQTYSVKEIIVIDDCSTDGTGDVVLSCGGVTLIRPLSNTGSKAGAQNFALKNVSTEFVMAIDADTTLSPDAIEKLIYAFDEPKIAAACGFVIPRHVNTIWERGRYIELIGQYNIAIKKFPANIFSGMFGFKQKEYYTSVSGTTTPSLGNATLP